ncbi:hypothetical protein ACFSCX_07870 [Bacillus salitolerans]|uniref:Uncharacterized protein n=1 Tax=Bacillus salitolerans TaxID=1437434 RepID=A0ABW4LQT2_9BACI
MEELLTLIENVIGKEAIAHLNGSPSPYNFPGDWSVNNARARSLGFKFTSLEHLIEKLVRFYYLADM